MTDDAATAINRANWNVWAAAQGQDGYYDSADLAAGADSLTDVQRAGEAAEVGEVDGLEVMHVQCHLGFEAISLARCGARVTGVDFSPVALAKAQDLARGCGVEAQFIEADVTDLPPALRDRYESM